MAQLYFTDEAKVAPNKFHACLELVRFPGKLAVISVESDAIFSFQTLNAPSARATLVLSALKPQINEARFLAQYLFDILVL